MSKMFGNQEGGTNGAGIAPPAPGRKLPPPPKPGASLRGGAAAPPPRIKPRPLDALNVDLSKSKAPERPPEPAPKPAGSHPAAQAAPVSQPAPEPASPAPENTAVDSDDQTPAMRDQTPALVGGKGGFDRARSRAKQKTDAPQTEKKPDRQQGRDHSDEYYQLKSEIFSALIDAMDMGRIVALPREDAEMEIGAIVKEIIQVKGHVMSIAEERRLVDDVCDDVLGYGPLEPLLERDDIADIMVNGAHQVYIETNGKIELTNIRFRDNAQLLEICQRIVSKVGRRVDESSPICDARLLDGSRVNVIAPPLSIDGAALTIRKFKKDKLKMTDLIKFKSITNEAAKVLEIASGVRCNILISGGTGSGKTTLLNCMSAYAADDERIITCEDSAELQLQQPHVVRLETRPANLEGRGEVTMRDLVKNCLRMRPERIIVGEVRGPEAFDLLQAMNTGHDGSMGTLHANSPRECLSRLESMITMGGFSLPSKTIREMICSAVNIIVQAQRLRDGSRRITHVTEVLGMEGETIITQDLVKYKIVGEDKNGKLIGRHVSTGIGQPAFWERARGYNREVDLTNALAAIDEE